MTDKKDPTEYISIEPCTNPELINMGYFYRAIKNGTYPETSVLAGQPSLQVLGHYKNLPDAIAAYPDAEVHEITVYHPRPEVPTTPPAWFDPMYAGERWNEED